MARTISQIKSSITNAFTTNTQIIGWYGLTPGATFEDQFSLVSFENIFFDVITFIVWTLENIFDVHKKEVTDLIANQKIPSLRWYRNEALKFQYGFDLMLESDQFSNLLDDGTGTLILATSDQIQASKIVKYAAVTKAESSSKISMKIAPENGNAVFNNDQMLAFIQYITEIHAAGDSIVIVNYLPDILKINFNIKYDPLVLLGNGISIINGTEPVKIAILNFLRNLPFDGELSLQRLEAAVLAVDGVLDLQNLQVQSKWIEPGTGYGLLQPIQISTIPKSGRFTLIDDVTLVEDWTGLNFIL